MLGNRHRKKSNAQPVICFMIVIMTCFHVAIRTQNIQLSLYTYTDTIHGIMAVSNTGIISKIQCLNKYKSQKVKEI